MKPLQVFIGYDPNEPIAFHVLSHSILKRASRPVSITPIYQPQLRGMGVWTRNREPDESTDFAITRFLTPWLSDFSRVSIFMDCDMLCLGDICDLEKMSLAEPEHDVLVVKHHYTPKTATKHLGQSQTVYPCKNWSSLMVFNGHRMSTRDLTPSYVNEALPSALHRFAWASDVGSLPQSWNFLVGEYDPRPTLNINMLHYTLGGPWFGTPTEYANEWHMEAADASYATQRVIPDPPLKDAA